MHVLFVHRNFPAQFGHIAARGVAERGWKATFVSEKLAPIEHVTATNTHFLLKAYKENGQIFIDEAADDDRLAISP